MEYLKQFNKNLASTSKQAPSGILEHSQNFRTTQYLYYNKRNEKWLMLDIMDIRCKEVVCIHVHYDKAY